MTTSMPPHPTFCPTLDLVEAGAILGMSRATTFTASREGKFPVEILRFSRFPKVRTADLWEFLGIPLDVPMTPRRTAVRSVDVDVDVA